MPTTLYLLRHAEAAPGIPDEGRPLTPKGLRQVEALALFLKGKAAFAPEDIWHSGLKRAEQTAQGLMQGLNLTASLQLINGLSPNAPVEPIARRLKLLTKNTLIVGHNPFLERLATVLLEAHGEAPVCHMRKASLMALEKVEGVGLAGAWQLSWFVGPGLYFNTQG